MTLKELFLKCNFDDVLTHIGEIEARQLDMASHYKEVFDRLRLTEAVPNEVAVGDEPVSVDVCGLNDEDDSKMLGQQLDVDATVPLEAICASCLYERTFYGFDDEDVEEFYRSGLTRHDKIERLIQRLVANPSEPGLKRKDVDYLFDTNSFDAVRYHSYTNDTGRRAAYIKELIEKYSHDDYNAFDRFIIHITTSSEFPMTEYEHKLIAEVLPLGKPLSVIWGCSVDEDFGKEMGVRIVMSKDKE